MLYKTFVTKYLLNIKIMRCSMTAIQDLYTQVLAQFIMLDLYMQVLAQFVIQDLYV